MAKRFTPADVKHIADLAAIPLQEGEAADLSEGFNETIDVVEKLSTIDVSAVEPTHQVTGLVNVFREDDVDESRMFTQEQALSSAKRVYDGYVVVPHVFDNQD